MRWLEQELGRETLDITAHLVGGFHVYEMRNGGDSSIGIDG